MTRVGVYEPLCYHCLFGLIDNDVCTMSQDCEKCQNADEYGTCFFCKRETR